MTVTSTEAPGGVVIDWKGPFRWCNDGPDGFFSSEYARASGVYLMTAPWNDGYLVWGPGITARPFAQRFWEHTKELLSGTYNILDAHAWMSSWRGTRTSPRMLHLRPRRASESAVTVTNRAPVTLHGIPPQFQV